MLPAFFPFFYKAAWMGLDLRLRFGSRFQPNNRGISTSVWLAARMHHGCGGGMQDRGGSENEKEKEPDREERE
jgi:hypothetical protein